MDVLVSAHKAAFNELKSAWDSCQSGNFCRIVVIEGESGSGKTDIIDKFIVENQIECIRSRETKMPSVFWRNIFDSIVNSSLVQQHKDIDPKNLPEDWQDIFNMLAQIYAQLGLKTYPEWNYLGYWQAEVPVTIPMITNEDEVALAPNIINLFTQLTAKFCAIQPLVFFVDNVDLSDNQLLDDLRLNILPSLLSQRLLIVFTLHSEHNSISEFVQYLRSIQEMRYIKIPDLNELEIARLLKENFPHVDQNRLDDTSVLLKKSDYKTVARVRDFAHWLTRIKYKWSDSVVEIPDPKDLLKDAFVSLLEIDQEVLQIASVQGISFCLEITVLVANKSEGLVSESLKRIQQFTPFLSKKEPVNVRNLTWLQFSEDRIWQWVYQTILEKNIADIHLRIALSLEETYAEYSQNISSELAHHFGLAKKYEKSSYYYAILSRVVNEQNIHAAIEYADKGLKNLESINSTPDIEKIRSDLLTQKGRALVRSDRAHEAEKILNNALEIIQKHGDRNREVYIHLYLGEVFLRKNMWQEGIDELQKTIDLAVETKAWNVIVESVEVLRDKYYRRGGTDEYFELCTKVIDTLLDKASGEDVFSMVADILEDKAWMYSERREYSPANEALKTAEEYLGRVILKENYSDVFYKIHKLKATVLRLEGDYDGALKQADKAIERANLTQKRKYQALAHLSKAATYRPMGLIQDGKNEFEAALQFAKRSFDLIVMAQIEAEYGLFLSNSGEKKEALRLYEQSKNHRAQANDVNSLQIANNNIAAINEHLGKFDSALDNYQNLYNQGVREDDKSRQSISLNHLGDIYRVLDRMNEAEHAHKQCIRLCEMLGRPQRKALALSRLGLVYLCLWQLEKASQIFKDASEIYQQLGESHEYAKMLVGLGRLELCKGSTEKAMDILERAQKSLVTLNDVSWLGRANLNLSLCNLRTGNVETAFSLAENAARQLSKDENWRASEAFLLLGRCYASAGKYVDAQNEISQARSLFLKLGLFHRAYQLDNIELMVEDAKKENKPMLSLSDDELRYNFNYLGL